MNINLRAGRADDGEPCGFICYEAFRKIADQHNFPHDFPTPKAAAGLLSQLFSRSDIYSVVAEVDGRMVGSNFLWENAMIAGVGPITVDPALQNVAVGKRLMEYVMRRAQDRRFAGVRLVQAAYHNRSLSLYTKLGFDTREPLSTIQGPAIGLEIPGHAVRLANEKDLEACNKLCLRVHGHDRGQELLDAVKQGAATIVTAPWSRHGLCGDGRVLRARGRRKQRRYEGADQQQPQSSPPGGVLPTRNSKLLRWCLENGLRIVQPMTLMTTGLYNKPRGAFMPSVIY